MRPTRLEVEGFSTFRERAVLDLDGLDLVAFTGATGAGKSTLIDAITFALYGSVARYDNTSRVAPVIHQLAVEAKVRLDFEVGGRRYIATRVVRRRSSKGGESESATTKEARLELVEEARDTTVLAGDVRELNRSVEDLLGLDFRQFTRTIVLPQGEFAAFLRDDRADRDKLLQRLLDLGIYERMGRLARQAATRARQQADILIEQQQRHPLVDEADLTRLADRVEALEAAQRTVEKLTGELAELDVRLDPLRDRVTGIDTALDTLRSVAPPDELADLDRQLAEAAADRAAQSQDVETARADRDRAAAQLDELPDKAQLVRTQSVVEQLEAARADVVQLEAQLVALARSVEALGHDRLAAEAAAAQAEDRARAARLAADADGWRAELVVGQPCPVCRQEVTSVPDHDAAGEMAEAEEERRRRVDELRSIVRQLAKAEGAEGAARVEIERQSERIDLLELQLSASPVVPDSDALAAQLERVEDVEAELRRATSTVAELEGGMRDAEARIGALEASHRSMAAELGALRDRLAALEPPVLRHRSLNEDYVTLVAWAEERSEAMAAERESLAREGKRMAAERVAMAERLVDCARSVDVEPAVDRLSIVMAEAAAAARAELAAAEERRADQQQTAARIEELDEERRLDDALGRHLRSGGFSSWLLAEALDRIVAKATVWLLELSNQQYSLTAGERSFAIIDHNNADEQRDVRTLSGGETFLASLALALALADSIAELAPVDAPRLESMFLDEGFGTLDPATLDVVASAIEELASTGRMIGIVTHVADLAERMPARFEVTKGPATSTVELVGV